MLRVLFQSPPTASLRLTSADANLKLPTFEGKLRVIIILVIPPLSVWYYTLSWSLRQNYASSNLAARLGGMMALNLVDVAGDGAPSNHLRHDRTDHYLSDHISLVSCVAE